MKCKSIRFVISHDEIRRVDYKYSFTSKFNMATGFYVRSSIIENGKDTNIDPFMASYPHLIDVGIMGHCIHGEKGLCVKAGIKCYQNGLNLKKPNMSLADFEKICKESEGLLDQMALGGRGDPDCHENFLDILKLCKKYHIVPNYTTSGFLIDEYKAKITKEYCGAVAVSWYRSDYTINAINTFIKVGCKTNIHYVVDNKTIDEAINLLDSNGFPKGINAVIFLLYKPVGLGTSNNVLKTDDERLVRFFNSLDKPHPYKIGFDSCFIPGVINNMKNVDINTLDTCEGARFSMYISSDMVALPCSFDQNMKYAFDIKNKDIYDAWTSDEFEKFRKHLKESCPNCKNRSSCMGGCPLENEVVLCTEKKR